jgi:short-subunit dehydrogenase
VIREELAAQSAEAQFVVNNAGFGLLDIASAGDHDEQLQTIDLNVRALTELRLPSLIASPAIAAACSMSVNGGLSARSGQCVVVH